MTPKPTGTLRIIGAVVVAGGRAIDIALIESDGCEIARRLEFQRVPLALDLGGQNLGAVSGAIVTFMGDMSLQPSAIDFIAVAHEADLAAVADLRNRFGMRTLMVDPSALWPRLPLAERVALFAARA